MPTTRHSLQSCQELEMEMKISKRPELTGSSHCKPGVNLASIVYKLQIAHNCISVATTIIKNKVAKLEVRRFTLSSPHENERSTR